MQNKPTIALNRPANMHRLVGTKPRRANIQRRIKLAKIHPGSPVVDDHTHCRFIIMLTHDNDRSGKPSIIDLWMRNKQMTLQTASLVGHAGAIERFHGAACIFSKHHYLD
jgi:hypothetical protein